MPPEGQAWYLSGGMPLTLTANDQPAIQVKKLYVFVNTEQGTTNISFTHRENASNMQSAQPCPP